MMGKLLLNEWIKFVKKGRLLLLLLLVAFTLSFSFFSVESSLRKDGAFNLENAQQELMKRITMVQDQISKEGEDPKTTIDFQESLTQLQQRMQDLNGQMQLNASIASGGWQDLLKKRNQELSDRMQKAETELDKETIREKIEENQFLIAHDTPPLMPGHTNAFDETYKVLWKMAGILFPLIGVIIGADIVSGEYHPATVKMILTRPVSRYQVALAKAFLSSGIAFLCAFLTIMLAFVLGGILHGFQGGEQPIGVGTLYHLAPHAEQTLSHRILAPILGSTSIVSLSAFLGRSVLFSGLVSVALAAISFALSNLFRHPITSFAVTTILTVGGLVIAGGLTVPSMFGLLSPFTYVDFIQIWTGRMAIGYNAAYINLPTATLVLSAWSLAMVLAGTLLFHKRGSMV